MRFYFSIVSKIHTFDYSVYKKHRKKFNSSESNTQLKIYNLI